MKASVTISILSTDKLHNKLHERALRIFSKNHFSPFEEFLSKGKSITVHERNLRTLPIEMYEILSSLSPEIMKGIFKTKTNYYNTLNELIFSKGNVKTVRYELKTMTYTSPKIWDLVPKEMKQVSPLNEFKTKLKICKLENCPC